MPVRDDDLTKPRISWFTDSEFGGIEYTWAFDPYRGNRVGTVMLIEVPNTGQSRDNRANDSFSSYRFTNLPSDIYPGAFVVTGYEHQNYGGKSYRFAGFPDGVTYITPDQGGDKITSFKVEYDWNQHRIIDAEKKAEQRRADEDARRAGGMGGMVGSPYRDSGTEQTGGALMTDKPGKELSLPEGPQGRIWYARTRKESSFKDGPHPGLSLAGPGTWKAEWGKPEENGLPKGMFLLTTDDPDDDSQIRPAGDEFSIVMARATQGDESAQMVLHDLGVPFQPQRGMFDILF